MTWIISSDSDFLALHFSSSQAATKTRKSLHEEYCLGPSPENVGFLDSFPAKWWQWKTRATSTPCLCILQTCTSAQHQLTCFPPCITDLATDPCILYSTGSSSSCRQRVFTSCSCTAPMSPLSRSERIQRPFSVAPMMGVCWSSRVWLDLAVAILALRTGPFIWVSIAQIMDPA